MQSIPACCEWHVTTCPFLVWLIFFFQTLFSRADANFISIEATSTDVKQVFSKGCLVLSHVHNRLSMASTCALMCLSAWSRLVLVREVDIKATASLPDVVGEEDELESGWDYMTYD